MSDTFDHEADAWDSLNEYGVEEDGSELHPANRKALDPNYYHSQFTNLVFKAETEKSFLVQFQFSKSYWIPKKLVRNKTDSSALIHLATLKKIVAANPDGES